jgi:hypothetical protein
LGWFSTFQDTVFYTENSFLTALDPSVATAPHHHPSFGLIHSEQISLKVSGYLNRWSESLLSSFSPSFLLVPSSSTSPLIARYV